MVEAVEMDSGQKRLHELGYKQELRRSLSYAESPYKSPSSANSWQVLLERSPWRIGEIFTSGLCLLVFAQLHLQLFIMFLGPLHPGGRHSTLQHRLDLRRNHLLHVGLVHLWLFQHFGGLRYGRGASCTSACLTSWISEHNPDTLELSCTSKIWTSFELLHRINTPFELTRSIKE